MRRGKYCWPEVGSLGGAVPDPQRHLRPCSLGGATTECLLGNCPGLRNVDLISKHGSAVDALPMRNVARSKQIVVQSKVFESLSPRMGGSVGLISLLHSCKIQSVLVR